MFNIIVITLVAYVTLLLFFFYIKHYLSPKYFAICCSFLLSILIYIFSKIIFNVIFLENNFFLYFDTQNIFLNFIETNLGFCITPLNFSFSFLVLCIGFTTNIYILNYFKNEADEGSFIFWINAFIFSMLVLLYASNFFTLFLGWELIGLTSFFLINFWQNRRGTLKSSFKAFSFNLASDVFFLAALICFYNYSNTTDCHLFFYNCLFLGLTTSYTLNIGIFFLTLCASIKSVQIIGHLWLPDSMEAPVPASALIHSATLVSAGVFLLCKFNILYILSGWSYFLTLIGSITAFYGGITAASQTDMKKLLAYSTMSHCGFLWILSSFSNFQVTVLYLFLHGLFKASTFYCSGSFIRFFNTQDSRWMGSGSSYIKLDSILLIICAANLGGLPFTIGYFYKQFFFSAVLLQPFNFIILGNIYVGMLSSIVYFYRLISYNIFDFFKNIKSISTQYLIINKFVTNKVIRVTGINHLLSTITLLLISFFISIFLVLILKFNLFETNFFFDQNTLDLTIISFYGFNVIYIIYFYVIYIILGVILVLITWRKNIYILELWNFFFLIFFFINF